MSTWYATESITRQHLADMTAVADRTRLRRAAPSTGRLRRRSRAA